MNKYLIQIFIAAACLALPACGSEDGPDEPQQVDVAVTLAYPAGITDGTLTDLKLSFENVNTQITETVTATATKVYGGVEATATVASGFYNVTATATLTYEDYGETATLAVTGYTASVQLSPGSTIQLDLFTEMHSEGFVIAEIFCAGTQTPQGTAYFGDTYFRIYNNSDEVLYADGLALLGTWFMTASKYQDLSPDITATDLTVQALYVVPGGGTDHPVAPGGSLLIANNAINHAYANTNSFDLTTADFEWYDESTNPSITDVDNPDVPNLERVFAMTQTVWDPNTQGLNAFAIARIPVDNNTYLSDYYYQYTYLAVPGAGVDVEPFTATGDCYRMPAEWVVDAVNMAIPGSVQWLVTPPSLDRGWTYCSNFAFDDSRLGYSVRRKVASHAADGHAVLQDTNNSTDDFLPRQTADPFHVFE